MTPAPWPAIPPRTPALAVLQPWASAIVLGDKDVENRTWETRYRGPLLIHASKRLDHAEVDNLFDLARLRNIPTPGLDRVPLEELPLGGVVGIVDLVACVRRCPSRWFVGPVGWILRNPRPLPLRRCRGYQSLFVPQFDPSPVQAGLFGDA